MKRAGIVLGAVFLICASMTAQSASAHGFVLSKPGEFKDKNLILPVF